MNSAWTLAALATALLSGCSARDACETPNAGGFEFDPNVTATPLVSSTTLTRSGETLSISVRAKLGNLPKLWQDDTNIVGGSVSLSATIAYQGMPRGGDGKTQMPRVSLTLGLRDTDTSVGVLTSEFQDAGGVGATLDAFNTCQAEDQQDCCKYGERECSVPLLLNLRRLDGSPFPPVDVTTTLSAEAEVSRCPIDDHQQAKLTLAAESP